MKQQTAVEWLVEQIKSDQNQKALSASEWMQVIEQAKQMEHDERKKLIDIVYNIGYTDAQCNHVNDADNLSYEIGYMQSQIDFIDAQIKDKENKIADMLINNIPDPEIKGWTIGPFGTPEKL